MGKGGHFRLLPQSAARTAKLTVSAQAPANCGIGNTATHRCDADSRAAYPSGDLGGTSSFLLLRLPPPSPRRCFSRVGFPGNFKRQPCRRGGRGAAPPCPGPTLVISRAPAEYCETVLGAPPLPPRSVPPCALRLCGTLRPRLGTSPGRQATPPPPRLIGLPGVPARRQGVRQGEDW